MALWYDVEIFGVAINSFIFGRTLMALWFNGSWESRPSCCVKIYCGFICQYLGWLLESVIVFSCCFKVGQEGGSMRRKGGSNACGTSR